MNYKLRITENTLSLLIPKLNNSCTVYRQIYKILTNSTLKKNTLTNKYLLRNYIYINTSVGALVLNLVIQYKSAVYTLVL